MNPQSLANFLRGAAAPSPRSLMIGGRISDPAQFSQTAKRDAPQNERIYRPFFAELRRIGDAPMMGGEPIFLLKKIARSLLSRSTWVKQQQLKYRQKAHLR